MNSNFEERMKEYHERLDNALEMFPDGYFKGNRILLNPKNEFELNYASSYLTFVEDRIFIESDVSLSNLKENKVQGSVFARLLFDYYDALYISEDKHKIERLMERISNDPVYLARLTYDIEVLTYQKDENIANYITTYCVKTREEKRKISLLFSSLLKDISSSIHNIKMSDRMIVYNEFHRIYSENRIDKSLNLRGPLKLMKKIMESSEE